MRRFEPVRNVVGATRQPVTVGRMHRVMPTMLVGQTSEN